MRKENYRIAVLTTSVRAFRLLLRSEALNINTQRKYKLVRSINDVDGQCFSSIKKLDDWINVKHVDLLIAIIDDKIEMYNKVKSVQ